MSWTSNEVVAVLTFLLPGFVAAAVFYSLTSHPKPSNFERVVQALIFTIVVEAVARSFFLVSGTFWTKPLWTEDWAIVFSVLIAVAVALISVYVSNNGHTARAITTYRFYPGDFSCIRMVLGILPESRLLRCVAPDG